jgi:hypothetical protein
VLDRGAATLAVEMTQQLRRSEAERHVIDLDERQSALVAVALSVMRAA